MQQPSIPSSVTPPPAMRAMLERGGRGIEIVGARRRIFGDTYYRLLHETWPSLLLQFLAAFMAFNLAFAALYYADPGGLQLVGEGAEGVPVYWRDFFFSVHTLVTIGYGNVIPTDLYVNIIVVFEAIAGVLGFALTTGLIFARFARPTARVMFSNFAVVAPFEGTPTIMLRAINRRHNLILEASARASLLRAVTDDQGHLMRRFFDVELVRDTNPVFVLSWTIMHRITPSSPFFGMTREELMASGDEIIVIISGTDESMAQTIHARSAYATAELQWDSRFVDILGPIEQGRRKIDYARFHDVEPIGSAPMGAGPISPP